MSRLRASLFLQHHPDAADESRQELVTEEANS